MLKKVLYTAVLTVAVMLLIACSPAQPSQGIPVPGQTAVSSPAVPESQTPPAAENTARPTPEDRVPRISIEELKKKMDSGEDVLIVDTRFKEEYAIDHIRGAVSAPLSAILEGKLSAPLDRDLVLYCG